MIAFTAVECIKKKLKEIKQTKQIVWMCILFYPALSFFSLIYKSTRTVPTETWTKLLSFEISWKSIRYSKVDFYEVHN